MLFLLESPLSHRPKVRGLEHQQQIEAIKQRLVIRCQKSVHVTAPLTLWIVTTLQLIAGQRQIGSRLGRNADTPAFQQDDVNRSTIMVPALAASAIVLGLVKSRGNHLAGASQQVVNRPTHPGSIMGPRHSTSRKKPVQFPGSRRSILTPKIKIIECKRRNAETDLSLKQNT